jgi:hypothetical protein
MLQPGTFADVIIEGPEYSDTLVIPEAAMQADDIIWYVQNGRLVSYQPVVLGRNDQGIVIAGRDVADGIVVGTLANASAGMAVSATPIDESLAQPRN